MAKGINLLIRKKEISARQVEFIRLAKVGSVVLLVFYCLVIAGVFSVWLITRQESQKIDQEVNIKKGKIADLRKVESLQVFLKQRLSALKSLGDEERLDYQRLLSYLDQFLKGGVVLKNIGFSKEGEITLSGEAVHAPVLADFLEAVSQEEALFSQVILSSLTREEVGSYTFNLTLETKNEI